MSVPVFEEVATGERRQVNGPIFGVRTLWSGDGASLKIDGSPVPLSFALLTIPSRKRPIDRLEMTGPILVQVAMQESDALEASAVPRADAPLAVADTPIVLTANAGQGFKYDRTFTRPAWATRFALLLHSTTAVSYGAGAYAEEIAADGTVLHSKDLPSPTAWSAYPGAMLLYTPGGYTAGSPTFPVGVHQPVGAPAKIRIWLPGNPNGTGWGVWESSVNGGRLVLSARWF